MYVAQEYDVALTVEGGEWRLVGRTKTEPDGSILVDFGRLTTFKLIRRELCSTLPVSNAFPSLQS
jgi:hypothetical protein